ncbi:olfactory protein-like [Lissotriton helveticus]
MFAMWMSLGLIFSSLLMVQAMDIPVMDNFDTKEFLGKWYNVAVASDCPEVNMFKAMLRMPITNFSLLDNGDVMAATGYYVGGTTGCLLIDMTYYTIKPGQYTKSVIEKSDIRFVKGDLHDSIIEYTQGTSDFGTACLMVRLFARKPEIPTAALEDFKSLVQTVGLSEGYITYPPRTGILADSSTI